MANEYDLVSKGPSESKVGGDNKYDVIAGKEGKSTKKTNRDATAFETIKQPEGKDKSGKNAGDNDDDDYTYIVVHEEHPVQEPAAAKSIPSNDKQGQSMYQKLNDRVQKRRKKPRRKPKRRPPKDMVVWVETPNKEPPLLFRVISIVMAWSVILAICSLLVFFVSPWFSFTREVVALETECHAQYILKQIGSQSTTARNTTMTLKPS